MARSITVFHSRRLSNTPEHQVEIVTKVDQADPLVIFHLPQQPRL